MATLVLTTVGGIVGGPVGAAIGGLLGNVVDRSLLGPKGREGPRLTELAVQTSRYGQPIPLLFGRMRVAGQVIWATDLVEHRAREGGKGRASTTTYSYSASLAVALSGRAIRDVGRIWADGNLLRGAAGDWKVPCSFRLHLGGEDQDVDPLIASAEGIGLASAHRGVAYAVFEDLPLETFGNRIPSLTFEVVADETAVAVGDVAREIAGGVIVGEGPAMLVDGFSAYGDGVRGVVETLAEVSGAWFVAAPGGLAMRDGVVAGRELVDEGRARWIAPASQVPGAVSVAHYDPARDWQAGVQRAVLPGARAVAAMVEVPVALSAEAARVVAEAMLARAEVGRTTRQVSGDMTLIDVAPGELVSIAGEGGVWRVASVAIERHKVMLDLVSVAPASLPVAASGGRVLREPDAPAGATILAAFEVPALGDPVAVSQVTVVACGEGAGWRRAAVQLSLDDGETWEAVGVTAAPGVIGSVVAPVPSGCATLVDRVAAIQVTLARADMTLANADAAALDRGANLALVGDELLQFARAEHLGGAGWRLSELWRGRRGTIAGASEAGARFVLLTAETVLALSADASAVRVSASGVGDVEPVEVSVPLSGASVLPPAPVHLTGAIDGEEQQLRWRRRSRTDWRWRDGVDAGLGEEREAYRVTISDAGGVREIETSVPVLSLPVVAPVSIAVRQLGTHGASPAAMLDM